MEDKINMGVTICRSKLAVCVCIFFLAGQSSPKLDGKYSVHWANEFNVNPPLPPPLPPPSWGPMEFFRGRL